MNTEFNEKRDPEQRSLFQRVMALIEKMKIPTRLAAIKAIFKSIADEEKDKKDDN